MSRPISIFSHTLALAALFAVVPNAALAQWTAPTPEELKMTSQPEVPGAPAVYLFREETTEDNLHMWSKYVRLKVLTEKGKEYANVELTQYQTAEGDGYTVGDIVGRTIHPDGTIIPFTGKPLEKLVQKTQGMKVMAKVFTLPDVEVGSIIEYRYKLRYDDDWYRAPNWFVQSELYTRKAHYLWKPTDKQLTSSNERGEELTSTVAWTPILPKGSAVKQSHIGGDDGQTVLELTVSDIRPVPDEDYMPPVQSFSYRVLFYYTPYRNTEEYWKIEGKGWSKARDKFIGPGSKVREAVTDLTSPADTDDQKLRKIYVAIMKLDNTAFTRSRSSAEQRAQGGEIKTSEDVWSRKRGSDDQITELFVAMARAAGMKAYVMNVTDRDHDLFLSPYLSFAQFDDLVAIVEVDGKEQFFDPGQRYCPYGQMHWVHTLDQGLRQTEGGSALGQTPGQSYTQSSTKRIANLTMDEHGEVTGTITMTWAGAPALSWRQTSLRGDRTGLDHDLLVAMENLLPKGMDVKMKALDHLEEYEVPLVATFEVKGPIGSATGKRMILPSDIFVSNARPLFPHEKRDAAVYFHYPNFVRDAVRITFPATLGVESLPASDKQQFLKAASYNLAVESNPTSVTSRRDFVLGGIIFPVDQYPSLREFYTKMDTKDQESIVLKTAPAPAGD
jgi:hypothetical protein